MHYFKLQVSYFRQGGFKDLIVRLYCTNTEGKIYGPKEKPTITIRKGNLQLTLLFTYI